MLKGEQWRNSKRSLSSWPPRSYIVDTSAGQVRRNRLHLNPVPQPELLTQDTSTHRIPCPEQFTQDTPTHRVTTRSQTGVTRRPPDRYICARLEGRCSVNSCMNCPVIAMMVFCACIRLTDLL